MNKIPKKDAERILNYLRKAKDIMTKYDEDEYVGVVDCFCDSEIAQSILDQLTGYEVMYLNSREQ
jgi:hypothetical protein